MTIDMQDVDMLRCVAEHTSIPHALGGLANRLEQAVRDIGTLRQQAEELRFQERWRERLEAELVTLRSLPVQSWQTIDSAPKDAWILAVNIYTPINTDVVHWRDGGPPHWRIGMTDTYANPTHWMPLPAPPDQTAHRAGHEE